jgi:hypothetical protein
MHLYEARVDPRRTFLQVFAGRVRLEPKFELYKSRSGCTAASKCERLNCFA